MAPGGGRGFTEAGMIGRSLGCVGLYVFLIASSPMQAHHSLAGVYDMKGEKEVSGTLTIIKFVNPHGSMHVEVKNPDGTMTEWVFTTGSATTLAQRGIGKNSDVLKAGDVITAKFIPTRNGNPLGFLKSVTKADGTVISISAGDPND
jgi:hypothetical protein